MAEKLTKNCYFSDQYGTNLLYGCIEASFNLQEPRNEGIYFEILCICAVLLHPDIAAHRATPAEKFHRGEIDLTDRFSSRLLSLNDKIFTKNNPCGVRDQ